MIYLSFGSLLRPIVQRLSHPVNSGELFQRIPQCFVRYRKQRWSPITPSKLFVVPERRQQDPEEEAELKTLYAHYRTRIRAIRSYLQTELAAKEAELHDKTHIEEEKQHLAWCLEENKKFNAISAKHREERQLLEQHSREQKEMQTLEELENKQQMLRHTAAEQVLKAKMEVQTFITPENLDLMIASALNKKSLFNFAIDLEGNRYVEQPDGTTVMNPQKPDSSTEAAKTV